MMAVQHNNGDGDDDDDVSLCSTTWTEYRSDYGAGNDYIVDGILAEHEQEDNKLWYALKTPITLHWLTFEGIY